MKDEYGDLIRQYENEMQAFLDIAAKEKINLSGFRRSIRTNNSIYRAAKSLISKPGIQGGLDTLYDRGYLHRSLEAVALEPIYKPIFTDEERRMCKDKLSLLEYFPK